MQKADTQWEVVVVDVSEHPIERPKKTATILFRKKHTLKSQVIVDRKRTEIIYTNIGKGRRPDFYLYKNSKESICESVKMLGDSGYQGLQKRHLNTQLPKRASKKFPLSKQDKINNHQISSERVIVENIIRRIKIFRITVEKYRNRRKRFTLRLNLICAIRNIEL